MQTAGKIAIIYTRVSTDEQVTYGTSLEGQKESCTRKAHDMGAAVAGVFEDAGISGALYLDARPQLQAALAMLESGQAQILICYSVSRLSRDVEHLAIIRKRIKACRAILQFVDMTYEDTASGKMAYYFNGVMAENERDMFRERSVNGKNRRIGDGLQPARGFRPMGFLIVRKLDILTGRFPPEMIGKYVIKEDEAVWVREIFRRFAAGASLFEVGRFMHESDVPTMRGAKTWKPGTIYDILMNPVHKGMATYGKRQRVVDTSRLLMGHKRADYSTNRPSEEWQYIPCPAIVDEATWDACQARLKDNQRRLSGNNQRRHTLTGLIMCPNCGRGLRAGQVRRKENDTFRVSYHCKAYGKSQYFEGAVCNPRHYNAEHIQAAVSEAIQAIASRPELVADALTAYKVQQGIHGVEAEQHRLSQELKALQSREKATIEAQIVGIQHGASPAAYESVFSELADKKRMLTERLGILERKLATKLDDRLTDPETVAAVMRQVQTALTAPEITPMERHGLLAMVVKSIVPNDPGATVRFKPWPSDLEATLTVVVRPGHPVTISVLNEPDPS